VCVHAANDIYYPILVLGIIAAGGVFAGTNPAYTPHELTHHINTAKVKYLISEPDVLEPLLSAAKECNVAAEKIWVFHPLPDQICPPGRTSWKQLLEHGEKEWVRFDDLQTCKNTTAMRLFSSGTTGLPKAAMVTHYNLIAHHELVFEREPARGYEKVCLHATPMFHASTAPRCHISTFKSGEKSYVMRRFDLEKYLACMEKYRVTELVTVPPIVIGIIMSPLNKKYSLTAVRSAACGAAPLSKEAQARLRPLLGKGSPITQAWGMTEATCIATKFNYPEDDFTGSVGRPIPNIDIKIVDDAGTDITGYDVRGELCLRGPTIIPGYFRDPEANKTHFDADGFYHTGDIGYCDGKRHVWYIVDRKKELIKVRAFQVAPPEIEAVLMDHPDIVDAAVIGVPASDSDSERPRAYVVRRPGTDPKKLTEDVVLEYVKPRLTRYKWLDGGVKFVDAIPKNASGKILKRILREQAKKEMRSKSNL